ncbi:MAG TPA: serine/threonine-protein kinase [Polyangia bacterium]|jgi:serine/threonine-protein kinase
MASHGRYTILGKLADGGMAEIFLGVQHGAEGFEKHVVLKRILTQYSADPQFRNMLLDEAHISMTLQHGNIVQVLDLGVASGRYFLALELVDGWDLEKILQRAYAAEMVFPAALGLYVVSQVCRALAYAHGKSRDGKPLGIVHRDISPNNVLVSGEGEVKLADFGIAKAQRKREQTAAGVIKGKVAYMSPEQAQGAAIDRRSDIFSVGSMLYRMLTDKLPFESNNDLESLLRVQKAEFMPPQEAKPALNPSLAAIIQRAMRLRPTERYQTAEEMLVEVERVLRTEFQSAGQTELKSWLEQIGRRDHAPSIGKAPRDTGGVISDMVGTDLSVGTSFELRDLEQPDRTELQRGRTPPPEPISDSNIVEARGDSRREPAPPRSGHTAEIVKPGAPHSRRSGGFWLGVILTLGAVVGARYLLVWAEHRGVMTALGIGGSAGSATPPPTVGPVAAAPPAPAAPPTPAPAPPPAAQKVSAADASAVPAPTAAAVEKADAHPAIAEAPPAAEKPAETAPEKKPVDQENDEEALLKKAVPNADKTVIGEDEAEEQAPAKKKPAPLPPKHGAVPGKPSIAEIPRVETAVLHITSAPAGAVVKTKAHVLGRTPIALHFKTGNTYEIVLIKSGYQPATRKVAVHSTADKKIAVALKRAPPPKRSFFHPHR